MSYVVECCPLGTFCSLRIFLFISSTCYLLCGIALITLGTVYEFDFYLQQQLVLANLTVPTKLLIPIGVFMVCISIISYYGSRKDNSVLLLIFACLAGLLLMFALGCFSVILVNYERLSDELISKMQENQQNYASDFHAREYWDGYHNAYQCCGIYRPSEWLKYEQNVPYSCCQSYPEQKHELINMYCKEDNRGKPYLRIIGCLAKLEKAYRNYWMIMLLATIGTTITQVECMVVTIYMALLFWKIQQEIKAAIASQDQLEELDKNVIISDDEMDDIEINYALSKTNK